MVTTIQANEEMRYIQKDKREFEPSYYATDYRKSVFFLA